MSGANGSRSDSPSPGGRDAATAAAPAALAAQARARPSSWVYEVDENVDGGPISAAQIRRAWRTDAEGAIVAGEYVDNDYYRPVEPAPRRRRRWPVVAAGGLALAVAAVVVLVVALTRGSHSAANPTARAHPASAPMPAPVTGAAARTQVRRAQARPAVVHAPVARPRPGQRHAARPVVPQLLVSANAPVWFCLQGAGGHVLIAGQTLAAGETLPTVRGSEFEIFAGNGDFTMVVNGIAHHASGSPNPVAYRISAGAITQLLAYPAHPCG